MITAAWQFLVAFALSLVMPPERWIPLGGTSKAFHDYLDRESIQRSGTKVTLWTRRDYAAKQRTAWNEIEVDCATRRNTILAYVQDDAGTVSHNNVRPHRASAPIAPNSVDQRIFDLVCR
jgi:hypothetical protein